VYSIAFVFMTYFSRATHLPSTPISEHLVYIVRNASLCLAFFSDVALGIKAVQEPDIDGEGTSNVPFGIVILVFAVFNGASLDMGLFLFNPTKRDLLVKLVTITLAKLPISILAGVLISRARSAPDASAQSIALPSITLSLCILSLIYNFVNSYRTLSAINLSLNAVTPLQPQLQPQSQPQPQQPQPQLAMMQVQQPASIS
jgi:hypothetical protein